MSSVAAGKKRLLQPLLLQNQIPLSRGHQLVKRRSSSSNINYQATCRLCLADAFAACLTKQFGNS